MYIRVRARGIVAGIIGEKNMSEEELEKKFVKAVRKAGGRAYKFVSPGTSGVPDRLVVMPDNGIGFVELKAPGKKSRPEQRYQQRILENLGCYVCVLDNPDLIGAVIDEIGRYRIEQSVQMAAALEVGGLI